jgi:Mn2+/Fe2+ NRAMP family transporter
MSQSPAAPGAESAGAAPAVQAPPQTAGGILRQLGPGLIIAGSIVGSGELIGTTKTGAEAGFSLLWLILLGCAIKVFAQVELGRCAIVTGRTTMGVLNELPGPRLRVNWLVWYWLVMFVITVGQLGGIVGGVGQALSLTLPITGDFQRQVDLLEAQQQYDRERARRQAAVLAGAGPQPADEMPAPALRALGPRPAGPAAEPTWDDVYWSAIATAATSVLLVLGRYRLIQNVSTLLVAGFTLMTVGCLAAQQLLREYAIGWSDLAAGLQGALPEATATTFPLATALATFGIIGVGANELIAYPYWCVEKGYARHVGPRDDRPAWAERARGWMRVMHWDALCSLVIYTFATVAFYLLGAGVLHRQGLNPGGNLMIRTLSEMYKPSLGAWTEWVFLAGALAVLYSTFFVATAGHARVATDAAGLFGLPVRSESARRRSVRLLSGLLPVCALAIYYWRKDPAALVLLGGTAQAIMLPMLGGAALYFRYRRSDPRIAPGRLWDALLWLSFLGLLVAGAGVCWTRWNDLAGLVRWALGM